MISFLYILPYNSSITPHSFFLAILIIILSFLVSSLCSVLVSKIGSRISLIDDPNDRSSHIIPTPRGGGVGIWIAFIIIGIYFTENIFFTSIAGATGLLGFFEDRFNFSSKLRLTIQIILSSLVVFLFLELPFALLTIALFLFWIVFITGTANFYNFMDGINGIAGLAGIVAFGLLAFFSYFVIHERNIALTSIALLSGCLGFLPFNFPKARVFMGDVGSVFLGFVFASYVMKLSTTINVFLCLIMFLCTFYADAIVTIYYRWKRGENLMQAHRSHLYQYLSNELKLPHWQVSLMYAIVQLFFGVFAILAYQNGLTLQIVILVAFSSLFVISYNMIKKIKPKMALQ